MPFKSTKEKLILNEEDQQFLKRISQARTEEFRRVERARMLLHYSEGLSITKIADVLQTTATKVNRCVNKALEYGVEVALKEGKRPGRPSEITDEAKAWIVELACQKPKEFGYSYEVWTTRLLSSHIQKNAEDQGHICLKKLAPGSVSKLLSSMEIQPHKINYYLQRRDPDFETQRAQVLHVYQQVEFIMENNEIKPLCDVYLSYD
ncbi:helix-turn-helix domain-containing protein, partial [Paenibacillus eucommiae]